MLLVLANKRIINDGQKALSRVMRVDVTEEFPFLVIKPSPYYDR
jgi:predicted phosphatase